MKARFNSKGSLLARVSFVLIALAGCLTSAFAGSRLYVDDFTIQPGQEKEFAVHFVNGDGISSLQMDFLLPEGLSFVSIRSNEARIERGVHSVMENLVAGGDGYRRIGVFAADNDVIPDADTDELLYVKVKADKSYSSRRYIHFKGIHLAAPTVPVVRYDLPEFSVKISSAAGHVAVGETAFSLKPDGKHRVDFYLNNMVDVRGMSGRLVLPEGLSVEKNSRGKILVDYGARLPQDATLTYEESTNMFTLESLSTGSFGYEGVLFSFYVVGTPELAQTSEIVIDEVEVSDNDLVTYAIDDVLTITVTNSYKADYEPAMTVADELQALFDAANKTIAEECADVKDSEELVAAAAAIQSQIDNMKAAVQEAYDNGTLAATKDELLAPKAEIEAAVAKLTEDAKAAQTAYENETVNKAANEAAYERLNAEIAALRNAFNEVVAVINGYSDEVKNSAVVTESMEAISRLLDDAQASVDADHEAVKLTESSTVPAGSDIADNTAKLEKNAANAQAAYGIESLRTALAAVKATIDGNGYTAEVLAELNEAHASILDAIEEADLYRIEAYRSNADFLGEAVPAINEKIATISAAIDELKKKAESQTSLIGDVDGDGFVMANDYMMILNSILEYSVIEEGTQQFIAADYNGDGTINIGDVTGVARIIRGADAAARVYNSADLAGSEATGISNVTVSEAVNGKIYSVGGKQMDGLKRGVNIIRQSGGSTKKVIVK